MAVIETDRMFLNSVNVEGEVKNMHYIAEKLEDCIREVKTQNVIQIITDNVSACKIMGAIMESKYSHIFWTSYIVRTLNLALKNIYAVKNTEANAVTYEQCNWITEVLNDCIDHKEFYHEPFNEVCHVH